MKMDIERIDDVPVSPVVKGQSRAVAYGSVPGLEDDELADPLELERQAFLADYAPVLELPVRRRQGWIRPGVDADGRLDWGAFGTVDWERIAPEFNKARYKADKLREELEMTLITFSIIKEHVPIEARGLLIKYTKLGIIEPEHIADDDARAMVRFYRRAERLKREIARLEGRSADASG